MVVLTKYESLTVSYRYHGLFSDILLILHGRIFYKLLNVFTLSLKFDFNLRFRLLFEVNPRYHNFLISFSLTFSKVFSFMFANSTTNYCSNSYFFVLSGP